LAPAEISKVFMDDNNHAMEIVVPDHQLSLAIGKRGQNVKLAAKLSTWRLDIMSESASSAKTAEAIFNLMLIPGMNETMAQNVYQSGFNSFKAVASAAAEDVMAIPGYEAQEKAQKLIDEANNLVEQYRKEGKAIPTVSARAGNDHRSDDAKTQADQRLKEEMAQLKAKTEADAQAANVSEES